MVRICRSLGIFTAFSFKSTHHSWTYERKCEWLFFSEQCIKRCPLPSEELSSHLLHTKKRVGKNLFTRMLQLQTKQCNVNTVMKQYSVYTLRSEINTHSHFLSYLHEWCMDLNKNCSEYTQGKVDSDNV